MHHHNWNAQSRCGCGTTLADAFAALREAHDRVVAEVRTLQAVVLGIRFDLADEKAEHPDHCLCDSCYSARK